MMMSGMRFHSSGLLLSSVLSLLVSRLAATDDTTFESRWKLAEENRHTDAGHDYITGPFHKQFYSKFYLHINECTQKTGERFASDRLRSVVELGSGGAVISVVVDSTSVSAKCFADLVKKDTFSKPPIDRYLVPVDIRFTKQ